MERCNISEILFKRKKKFKYGFYLFLRGMGDEMFLLREREILKNI